MDQPVKSSSQQKIFSLIAGIMFFLSGLLSLNTLAGNVISMLRYGDLRILHIIPNLLYTASSFAVGAVLLINRRGAPLCAACAFKALTALIFLFYGFSLYELVFMLAMLVLSVLAALGGKKGRSTLAVIPLVLGVLYLILSAVNIVRYVSYDLGLPFLFYFRLGLSALFEFAAVALTSLSFLLVPKPAPYTGYAPYAAGRWNSNPGSCAGSTSFASTPPSAAPAAQQLSAQQIDNLKRLKELLDSGILTQDEFNAKKKQILGL